MEEVEERNHRAKI